jgi:hypothetical protein
VVVFRCHMVLILDIRSSCTFVKSSDAKFRGRGDGTC